MNRFIPWYEIYMCTPIVGLSISAAMLVTTCADTHGVALFGFWIAAIVISFVCVFVVGSKLFSPPDYMTQQRVRVWSDIKDRNFVLPTLPDLEMFLDSFCERAAEVIQRIDGLDDAERSVTQEQLRKMLLGAKFLFTKRPSALNGIEWRVKEPGCAQRGKMIAVKYHSPFTTTNIFTALWHMVNETILLRDPDPAHENSMWWCTLDEIQAAVENDIYQIRAVSGSLHAIS